MAQEPESSRESMTLRGRSLRAVLMTLLVALNLTVITGVDAVTSPAGAAPDPNLGPVAPPGETFCYASADGGNRGAFIRMVGVPGDPGFTVQVDNMRVALGRSNVEALAIRPSGGIYMVDDPDDPADPADPIPAELGRMVPGLFDPTVDNDATNNATAGGNFVRIADLNDGVNDLNIDVDGLTFIETDNLTAADDVLIGSVRKSGDDTIVTIDPTSGLTGPEWPVIAPPELVSTPDNDGIANIANDDVDDIAWDPASDRLYAVLGGSTLNYMGLLVWVLDDGAGGTTGTATIPRSGTGAPDFSDVLRLDFVRLGVPAVDDVEGLGFSNVGATFGTFFGMVGGSGSDDDELLVFDKGNGASTSLIDVKLDAAQGTGNEDYEAIDCVQPVMPAHLTIAESATPADGTAFTFDGGDYGTIGPGETNDGLIDGETEIRTVSPGTYVIAQDPEAGWSLDDITCTGDLGFGPTDWSIDLVNRELTVTVDEGQAASCTFENSLVDATVGDRVWLDTDGDGIQDGGENGINGVTMTLRNTSGGVVATQDTAGDGDYDFTGVDPGTYTVTVDAADLPAGAQATYDLDGTATLHVASVVAGVGADIDTVDFGYVPNDLVVAKTVYRGHDAGAGCPGGESVPGINGEDVTYCFVVTNNGDAPLSDIKLADADLGVDEGTMIVLSGSLAALAPGGSISLYYDGTIAGDLVNTVTASGTTSSGAVLTAQDTASVDEIAPAITLDKTVYAGHDAGAGCTGADLVTVLGGDAVTYCFVATNTGDSVLADIRISDPDLSIDQADMTVSSGSLASLLPGQSVALHYQTTAAADLVNTALTAATPPGGPDVAAQDDATVEVVAPDLTLDKTVYLGTDAGASCPGSQSVSGENGQAVTYCFVVTNTGDVTLTDVQVDDLDLGIDELGMDVAAGSLASLAAGQSVVLYVEELIAGDLTNTATASATPPAGPDPTDTDDAVVDELVPAISIDKTVYAGHDAGASCAGVESVVGLNGDAVTYCFSVTNTGDTDLDVTVDDADLAIDDTDMTVSSGSLTGLAAGASVELYYETSIAGDLSNTASTTGTSPIGDKVSDTDDASVDEIAPSISIDKTVYAGHDAGTSCAGSQTVTARDGDPVTYCFSVTNTGDATLTAIQVDDPDLGIDQTAMTALPGAGSTLALLPGQTVTLYHETTITQDLVNTATASGTPPTGPDPTDSDTAEVIEVAPAISIDKTVYEGHDGGAACPGAESVIGLNGDAVTYCFLVTNTGDSVLTDVQVEDADLGIDQTGMGLQAGSLTTLNPGATVLLSYETTIAGDLDPNTASASATPLGGPDPSDTDTASVLEVAPGIAIDKTVYRGHDGGASCAGSQSVDGENGDDVTYCFEVTNTGDAALTDVVVADADLGVDHTDMALESGSLSTLAPGASVLLSYETTITGDLVNTATTSATPPTGPDPTDSDTATVRLVAPGISIDKTVYLGHDSGAGCAGGELATGVNGSAVTYCFSVTNTGGVPLDVVIDDTDLGITSADMTVLSGSLTGLPAGETVEVYYDATIDGDLVNDADVTGTSPAGAEVTDTDDAEVDEVAPGIRVDKTVYLGHDSGAGCLGSDLVQGENGEAVTYCFEVTNTGDTVLDPVTLFDGALGVEETDMAVLGGGSPAPLAAAERVTLFYETTIDGDLVNTVLAEGTPLDRNGDPVAGHPGVDDTDVAEVDELVPGVSLDKTVHAGHDAGASCPGDELVTAANGHRVTYCFAVTNTGEVPLDIVIDDADLGITSADMTVSSGTLTGLPVGDTVELHFETLIAGDLVNVAEVTGSTPADAQVTDEDRAEVEEVDPSIRIDKTVYAGHDGGGSCTAGDLVTGENGEPVTYCFEITNTGDATLSPVTVTDADLGIDGSDMTVASGQLSSLAPNQSVALYVETTIDGDLVNTAATVGTPRDRNDDPVVGFPGGVTDDDDAAVDELIPEIGVAKTVVDQPAGNGDGSYTLTYGIEVQNTGDVGLEDVQLTDDLEATFAGAEGWKVNKITSSDLSVNFPGYDGRAAGDPNLLRGTDTLAVGETKSLLLTVTVTPGAKLGPYVNQAIGRAATPFDDVVADLSDSGTDSDPDRTNPNQPGDTGGTDDPVPTEFPPVDLSVTKTADSNVITPEDRIIDWTILVRNDGPGDDGGPLVLTDEILRPLEFVSANGSGWDCVFGSRVVTCTWKAALAAGETSSPLKIKTAVPEDVQPGTKLANGASVVGTGSEVTTGNNQGLDEVTVIGSGSASTDLLPRTGSDVELLVLVGFGLVFGGRALARRRDSS